MLGSVQREPSFLHQNVNESLGQGLSCKRIGKKLKSTNVILALSETCANE